MRNWISIGILLMGISVAGVAQTSSGNSLESEYKGKIRVLKNFDCANSLDFDADGKPLSSPKLGPWTKCGYIKLKRVTNKADKVELEGQRVVVVFRDQKPQLMTTDRFRIQVRGVASTEESVRRSIENLFIDPKSAMKDFVPDYW